MKLNKLIINKWLEEAYPVKNKILSKYQLLKILINFKNDIVRYIPSNYSIIVQLKFKGIEGQYYSISKCNLIKMEDYKLLIEEFLGCLEIREGAYAPELIDKYILSYKIFDTSIRKSKINTSSKIRNRIPNILIHGYNLPKTMDLYTWGEVVFLNNSREARVFKFSSLGIYDVRIELNILKVELKFKDRVVVRFTDELLNPGNLTEFKRTIKNHTYYFKDGEVIFKSLKYTKPYIKAVKQSAELNENFITMDLETRNIEGRLIPFAVGICTGEKNNFFFLKLLYE